MNRCRPTEDYWDRHFCTSRTVTILSADRIVGEKWFVYGERNKFLSDNLVCMKNVISEDC